jgi:hypothetical protein
MNKIRIRISAKPAVAVAGAIVAGTVLAACGGSGGTGGSTPAAAAASPTSTSNAAAAYRTCLEQHGVTLPSRAPGQGRPSGGAGGGGGGGFGGGGGGFSTSPQMQAALQACASVRPTGGAGFGGFGGGRGGAALTAFRNCMSQQGVVIPTTRPTAFPTAPASGSARYLGGLDPNDPKVAAALKVCSPLLPSRSASPSATS